jgi:hypothetical protein
MRFPAGARSWWLITQRSQTPKIASRKRAPIADKPDRNRDRVTAVVTLRQLTTSILPVPNTSSALVGVAGLRMLSVVA